MGKLKIHIRTQHALLHIHSQLKQKHVLSGQSVDNPSFAKTVCWDGRVWGVERFEDLKHLN